MRIGLLVTGDISVRAAHSLQAHPEVDEVVVIGPATSKSFEVVDTADGCDFLVGSGDTAPGLAVRRGVPLIWDGLAHLPGVAVWGASPTGLALALASRESDPRLVAMAHPDARAADVGTSTRFPDPVGRLVVRDEIIEGHPLAVAHSPTGYAACLVESAARRVTIVDDAAFLSGIALAAGIAATPTHPNPVWTTALPYLETATEMGLVMAEDANPGL